MRLAQLLNQNSFFVLAIAVLLTALAITAWRQPRWLSVVFIAGLLVTTAGWFVLRPQVDTLTSTTEAEALIAGGQPTMIAFFSQR